MHFLQVFLLITLGIGLLSGCNTPLEPAADGEKAAPTFSQSSSASAVSSTTEFSTAATAGARVNVPGCQNDDGTADIILPDGSFRTGLPVISSNCVLNAGPTEHLIVHSELPEDVSAPDRPVVWNYENTGARCWANNKDPNYTTNWEQRITPGGKVHLTCHFNANKNGGS